MAVISNTAQGLGQPARGTCLSSLGTTAVALAYSNGLTTTYNSLVVPSFGTHVALSVYAAAADLDKPTATLWLKVPTEASNPNRNWPIDLIAGTGMGPGDRELWFPETGVSLNAPNQRFQGDGAYTGEPVLVPLQGADEITCTSIDLPSNSVLVARFVSA